MRRVCIRIGSLMVAALALAAVRPARADAVIDWNAIMEKTVAAPPTNPFFQARWAAIEQLAVFEAVNTITGDYEPYLGTLTAPPGASPEAAAIFGAANRPAATISEQATAVKIRFSNFIGFLLGRVSGINHLFPASHLNTGPCRLPSRACI